MEGTINGRNGTAKPQMEGTAEQQMEGTERPPAEEPLTFFLYGNGNRTPAP